MNPSLDGLNGARTTVVEERSIGVTVRANTTLDVFEPRDSFCLRGKELLAFEVTVTGTLDPTHSVSDRSHSM